MKNKLLSLNNISKIYYTICDEVKAVENVSFDIYEGEFVSIVGPSGCGKSTILNIINGMDTKSSGEVVFNKKNMKLGYMLQSDSLLPWLNVTNNAMLGLNIKKEKSIDNTKYVNYLIDTYGLKDFIDKYPHELSGGMRQRVALIRTLALKPDILILDEPFSKLDYQSRLMVSDDVYKIIKNEKKTAIMVTHDLAESIY